MGALDLGGLVMLVPPQYDAGLDIGAAPGYGLSARVGLLQEGSYVPAVSWTGSFVDPPAASLNVVSLASATGATIDARVTDIDPTVRVSRWSIAKHFGPIGLGGGTSHVRYRTRANVAGSASDGSITDGDMSIHNAGSGRRSRFLDGSIALGERVSLEVELGRLYGGGSPTGFAEFGDGSGTRGRTYLTAGARVAVGKLRLWR